MASDMQELLRRANAKVAAMTQEERVVMRSAQRESWVRGEMSRPKPKYKWVDGVKVYDIYEDYCA